jgi:hypothetical protein
LSGLILAPAGVTTLAILVRTTQLSWFVILVLLTFVLSGISGARHLLRTPRLEQGVLRRPSFWCAVLILPVLTIVSFALAGGCNEEALTALLNRTPFSPGPGPRLVAVSGLDLGETRVVSRDGAPSKPGEVLDALASAGFWGVAVEVDASRSPWAQASKEGFSLAPDVGTIGERLRSFPSRRVVLVHPMARPSQLGPEEYVRWRRRTLSGWAKSLGANHLELPARTGILDFPEADSSLEEWDRFLEAEASALRVDLPGIALGVTVCVSTVGWARDRPAWDYLKRMARRKWIDWVALRLFTPRLPDSLGDWMGELEGGLKNKFWLLTSPGVTGTERFSSLKRQDRLWMEVVRSFVRHKGITTWAHYPLAAYDLDPREALEAFAGSRPPTQAPRQGPVGKAPATVRPAPGSG